VNWKLVFRLSLFGLAMGVATVYVIPSNIEPLFWLVVFGISAYLIAAKAPGSPFFHGLAVGLANCVWVTAAHALLFPAYEGSHPAEMAAMSVMPFNDHPRMLMAIVGPIIGVVSGIIIGLLALGAARLLRRAPAAPAA
jgi:hypothetical protein